MRLKFTHLLAPDDPRLLNLALEVRQSPCPHCRRSGALIRHGYSGGYRAHGHTRDHHAGGVICGTAHVVGEQTRRRRDIPEPAGSSTTIGPADLRSSVARA